MRKSTNGKQQSKSSHRIEDLHQDKGSGKLLGVCKLLLKIYQKLQSHSKISQWTQRKEGMEMGKITSRGIQRVKRENHKSTYTCSTKKKRKIPSKNRCFRTCYRKNSILRTRRKMETYHIFVKNNATCGMKLWNLW